MTKTPQTSSFQDARFEQALEELKQDFVPEVPMPNFLDPSFLAQIKEPIFAKQLSAAPPPKSQSAFQKAVASTYLKVAIPFSLIAAGTLLFWPEESRQAQNEYTPPTTKHIAQETIARLPAEAAATNEGENKIDKMAEIGALNQAQQTAPKPVTKVHQDNKPKTIRKRAQTQSTHAQTNKRTTQQKKEDPQKSLIEKENNANTSETQIEKRPLNAIAFEDVDTLKGKDPYAKSTIDNPDLKPQNRTQLESELALFDMAVKAENQKRYASAIGLYQSYLTEFPDGRLRCQAQYAMMVLDGKMKNYQQALKRLEGYQQTCTYKRKALERAKKLWEKKLK